MQLQLTGQRSSPITVHKGLLCSMFFETLNNVYEYDLYYRHWYFQYFHC